MNPPSERVASRSPLFIRRVDAIPIALPLAKPMKMANVTIATADNVLVRIEADGGLVGWGEAASAPTMTGDTQGSLVAAIRHLAPLIIGTDAWSGSALMRKLGAALYGNTGAHSAIELALLDLAGRAAGLPAINLIGGPLRRAVAPMWLLGNATPAEDAAEARAKLAQGFRFFKVKVGAKSVEGDIASTLAVRDALGIEVPICADANCGFAPADARRYVDATREARLIFLEQPFGPHDLKSLATLARLSPLPLGADEGIHSLDDVTAHAEAGAGGVSLKLIKLGGMSAAVEAARLCARLGLSINVAAKIAESSIASAAAINLACAAPSVDWGVSLTHFYLAHDIVKTPLKIADGLVALPEAPGLGVEIDEEAVAQFTVKGF
ncbi:MAG TPA: enolase C-terminal domain-like protein [Xanthobacteraceae bacterium]|nr:enolase C-terminal domain-like protein [Xanthobacteraceae bacterium]